MQIWLFIHMNPDEDHDEHNNNLKYSQEHNNILKYSMIAHNFKWKLVGPKTRGTRPLVILQRLQRLKNSINRDQDLKITHTFAKHTRKQHKSVWSFSKKKKLISQRFQEVFKSVHQYFSYLFKDKSLPPFFSCLIQIIQTPYKL